MKRKPTYNPLATARQQALQSMELAAFLPRAAAFLVDIGMAGALFVVGRGLFEAIFLKGRGPRRARA